MTESTDQAETTKKPRRRLTPEERIAERQAEIERIKETFRLRALDRIAEIRKLLEAVTMQARKAGLVQASACCEKAIEVADGHRRSPMPAKLKNFGAIDYP